MLVSAQSRLIRSGKFKASSHSRRTRRGSRPRRHACGWPLAAAAAPVTRSAGRRHIVRPQRRLPVSLQSSRDRSRVCECAATPAPTAGAASGTGDSTRHWEAEPNSGGERMGSRGQGQPTTIARPTTIAGIPVASIHRLSGGEPMTAAMPVLKIRLAMEARKITRHAVSASSSVCS